MNKPSVREIEVTIPVDTAALAVDDVVNIASKRLEGVTNLAGGEARLIGIDLHDRNDQAAGAYDVFFMNRDVSLGTANGAIGLSDDDAAAVRHVVRVGASDFVDLINSRKAICGESTPGLVKTIKCVTGSRDLWVGIVVRSGTPTFADGKLTLTCYFQDVF